MALLGKPEKIELERMLSNVCTVALWELGVTNGVTDDDAWASTSELITWLAPIMEHFDSTESNEEK